ncbi:leucine-rich repeat domain-containing protein [Ochrovirga pacifica]|uniref:hypothetical protein n=1 Tax=Ochrovirga pacifica TaxID=1042376 RepID=UPI00025583BD|nr:hypothetical protein [Ochrovirga pacifica]
MKRIFFKTNISFSILTLLIFTSCSHNEDPILSTEKYINIPDPYFEQKLIEQGIDSDGIINQQILKQDAENITVLNLNTFSGFGEIEDLTGIEGFTNLTFLSAANQKIHEVDLSANTKLDTLYLYGNYLTEINFVNNPNLIFVDIQSNRLQNIKGLSYAKKLTKLNVSWNDLEFLNIHNSAIKILHVSHNLLKGLQLTSAPNLRNILATSNQISYINLHNNTKLETLLISDNKLLELVLEQNKQLTHLYASTNKLYNLDVSYNEKLVDLRIDRNPNLTCIKKGSHQNIGNVSLSNYQSISENCD